jgi:uncharacterized protein YjbJ (UPF0337 family)
MNDSIISGKWKEIKGEVMKTWGELTSDEVERTKGNAKSLIGLLEQKFGMAREEAKKKIDELYHRHEVQGETEKESFSDKVNSKIDTAKESIREKSKH